MAEPLPVVVGDPGATKVTPVLLVDALGNPIDATHPIVMTGGGTTAAPSVVKPFAAAASDWSYAAASGGIANTTTAVTIKAAAGAGIINYLTWLDVSTDGALATATEVAVRNGAAGTVIWRMKINTAGLQGGRFIQFANPIKSSANTLLEFVGLTASATGLIYFNAGGYSA
ncbi:MAG: hypothetical protein E5X72_00095 [Mesorhizobium sp.]|uniref:hypothetical protein n=1 Tax=Mesorhizobium sp. TaxID=1871066 RepID=UPI0012002F2C|nr:hypothetical protein [Mesorhizobium sp.]TIP06650.1 MAG: hypothetical protein E5X72_00095 [Mesorhizobium sp.]